MFQIITLLLGLVAVIAFVWFIAGSIPGIILLVMMLKTKDKQKKKQYFKWVKICLGGLVLLILVGIIYAIFITVSSMLGYSPKLPSNLRILPSQ